MVLGVLFPLLCFAQPVIKEIEIRGLETIEEDEVRGDITIEPGDTYDARTVNEQIKTLFTTGKFARVEEIKEPLDDGIRLVFAVEENRRIRDVSVTGNREFSAEQVKRTLPFEPGDFLPVNADALIRTKIAYMYAQKQIYRVDVNTSIVPADEEHEVDVSIFIDEGERLLIKDLRFKGNESYSSLRLRLLAESRGSWLLEKRYYNDTAFEEDLNTIRQFYRSRGYLDVEVRRGTFTYNRKKQWVSPVIRIDEGVRYRITDIDVSGYRIFRKEEIMQVLKPMKGRYFSVKRLRKCFNELYEMYANEGFIMVEPNYDFDRDPETGTAQMTLSIEEHSRIYVGDVKIEKTDEFVPSEKPNFIERWYLRIAPPVKEDVIRRELLLEPGDVYRLYRERRTAQRLKRMGIFEDVTIRREPTKKDNVMDMVVSVKEGVTQALLFGVGYGDETGPYFQTRYRERNLFGEAKDLNLNAMISKRLLAFSIGYRDRHFRGTDTSFAMEIFRDMFYRYKYGENHTGATVTFGFPAGEYLKHYVRVRGEYVQFDDVDDDIEEDLDSYPVGSVRYRLVHDTRDDVRYPTSGDVKAGGLELGYADGALVKFTGNYRSYWRLYKDLIYAVDARVGVMPYDADNVGITERLYMGGARDLRGFKNRRAGPHDEGEDEVPTGGSVKIAAQNELRFPIYDQLRGLFFLDIGTIDDEFPGLGKARASTGLGLRLDIKVFYIALDFAYPFLEHDDDETRYVHFRLGSLF